MTTGGILLAVLVSAVCTFTLRALPFLAFNGERRMPLWLDKLGQVLPAAIMAVLIVYCLKDVGSDLRGIAFPKGIAVAAVAITYKWKHNTLISIAAGTILHMVLLRVL